MGDPAGEDPRHVEEGMKRKCCFVGCSKDAEFVIYDQNDRRPDCCYSDACEEHVGALIGSVYPTEPKGPWVVIAIDAKE